MEPKKSTVSLVIDDKPYSFIYHDDPSPVGVLELTDIALPSRIYVCHMNRYGTNKYGQKEDPFIGQIQMLMDYFLNRHIQGTTFPIEFKFESNNDSTINLIIHPLKEGPLKLIFQKTPDKSTNNSISLKKLSLDTTIENKWENLRDLIPPDQNQYLKENYCQIKKSNDGIVYMRGYIPPHSDTGGIFASLPHNCNKRMFGPLPQKYRPSKKVCFSNDCEINSDGTIYLRSNMITFDRWFYHTD